MQASPGSLGVRQKVALGYLGGEVAPGTDAQKRWPWTGRGFSLTGLGGR